MPYPHTPDVDLLWRGIAYPARVAALLPDDLAAALGLTGTPDKPKAAAAAIPDALKLINGVDVYREIQVIPTIGAGGAKRILENRPNGGYPSLDAVWKANPELLEPPFKTDLNTVAAWGAE